MLWSPCSSNNWQEAWGEVDRREEIHLKRYWKMLFRIRLKQAPDWRILESLLDLILFSMVVLLSCKEINLAWNCCRCTIQCLVIYILEYTINVESNNYMSKGHKNMTFLYSILFINVSYNRLICFGKNTVLF